MHTWPMAIGRVGNESVAALAVPDFGAIHPLYRWNQNAR